MIKKENLDKTSAWPFVEAKKMLRERKSLIEKKGKITLQTGYGPSGLPHIGTFGEVARTSIIVNALKQLTDLPTEIITFSDDMDGLRKVPDNVPNQELLKSNLNLNFFKNSFNISLLCSPKLLNFSKGSGLAVNGFPKFFFNTSPLGTLSGTFLKPSISSENVINS